jgi:hypothetical protein
MAKPRPPAVPMRSSGPPCQHVHVWPRSQLANGFLTLVLLQKPASKKSPSSKRTRCRARLHSVAQRDLEQDQCGKEQANEQDQVITELKQRNESLVALNKSFEAQIEGWVRESRSFHKERLEIDQRNETLESRGP